MSFGWPTLRAALTALPVLIAGCGNDSSSTQATLIKTVSEPAGSHCPYGGVAIVNGRDGNHDGLLTGPEISATSYVCKNSAKTVIVSSSEPAGNNCPFGGTRLDAGTDQDRDGSLSAAETESTQFICYSDSSAREAFGDVEITTLDEAAKAEALEIADEDFNLTLTLTDATEIEFPKLRFVFGTITIRCTGAALTVHFPQLEVTADQLIIAQACDTLVIDAPEVTGPK